MLEAMSLYGKIIFGGTFDPVHLGHTGIAREIAEKLGVRRVILLPTAGNPLKHIAAASAEQRLEMLRIATAGDELFEICDYELFRTPPTYTIDTMEHLAAAGQLEDKTGFVIGADSLKDLHHWRRVDEFLEMADLIIAARPPEDFASVLHKIDALKKRFGGDAAERMKRNAIQTRLYDISSTEIRRLTAAGESIAGLVDPKVEQYIIANGLYRKS